MTGPELFQPFFDELEKAYREDFAKFSREMQDRFDNGDGAAVLYLINVCFENREPVPEWAQEKLRDVLEKIYSRRVKSWDEVFGRPLPKGKQLATERRQQKLAGPIWQRVVERHEAGDSITKELFEEVGREVGVSGTIAAEIYYKLERGFLKD